MGLGWAAHGCLRHCAKDAGVAGSVRNRKHFDSFNQQINLEGGVAFVYNK